MNFLFWFALGGIIYTYFGYPLLIIFYSKFRPFRVGKKEDMVYPKVSVVIAARNEEKNMERRLRNLFEQNYPAHLEIIVVSDGSRDATETLVAQYKNQLYQQGPNDRCSLQLVSYEKPKGKPFALSSGIAVASGEIVVFTDCRQRFANDAITRLVHNFSDDGVGCVSGELIFEETPGSAIQSEMGTYWNFEKWLRKLESKTGFVPGATGAIYAIRKKLFQPIPIQTLLDDVLIPLNIAMQGYHVLFDSSAVAYDVVSKDFSQEKKRKIRTLAGNWQLLALEPALFNPLKNPLWVQFVSHKICRLLVPYLALILLFSASLLRNEPAVIVLILFGIFILMAALPEMKHPLSIFNPFMRICKTLLVLNYFAFLAPLRLLFAHERLW
ncbi:MAG: glycosyltransferase family 2 protein [Proteobacteria bacterium]|nr:glycosyltransferase family 2 protein [Pseudomonadota bacterium]